MEQTPQEQYRHAIVKELGAIRAAAAQTRSALEVLERRAESVFDLLGKLMTSVDQARAEDLVAKESRSSVRSGLHIVEEFYAHDELWWEVLPLKDGKVGYWDQMLAYYLSPKQTCVKPEDGRVCVGTGFLTSYRVNITHPMFVRQLPNSEKAAHLLQDGGKFFNLVDADFQSGFYEFDYVEANANTWSEYLVVNTPVAVLVFEVMRAVMKYPVVYVRKEQCKDVTNDQLEMVTAALKEELTRLSNLC